MDFKDILKNRRKELGLTLEDIGKAVGVAKATVQRWESGEIKNLRRDKINALAKVLKISVGELMGWNESDSRVAEIYHGWLPGEYINDEAKTVEALKVALFKGSENVTDEMWNEVVNFARFIEQREAEKNKNN